MSDDKKVVVVVEDGLQEYLDLIVLAHPDFRFTVSSLDRIEEALEGLGACSRDRVLVVVGRSFCDDRVEERLKSAFHERMSVAKPHLLYLYTTEGSGFEEDRVIHREGYFYYLPIESDQRNFYAFLVNVFRNMQATARIDEYIINSFQDVVDSELVRRQKRTIEKLYRQLEALNRVDVLTNVLNRRAFFEEMERELNRAVRSIRRLEQAGGKDGAPIPEEALVTDRRQTEEESAPSLADHYGRFSCLMVDLDHFKSVNDQYGHLAGDAVLRRLGESLTSNEIFRETDIVGRYGGEEFVIVLPETCAKDAKKPAERLRRQVEQLEFHGAGEAFHISVSIGISEFHPTDRGCEDVVNRADRALYHAKRDGRGKVVVYEDAFPE